jgi:hypothetical protein
MVKKQQTIFVSNDQQSQNQPKLTPSIQVPSPMPAQNPNKQIQDSTTEKIEEVKKEVQQEVTTLKKEVEQNKQVIQELKKLHDKPQVSAQHQQPQPAPPDTTPSSMQSPPTENGQKAPQEQQKVEKKKTDVAREFFRIKTFFPIDLSPDELVILEDRVDLIYRSFPSTENLRSADIKDIAEVNVLATPILASITIILRIPGENQITMTNLKKSDAVKARQIIEGLTTMVDEGVDLSKLSKEEVVNQALSLGKLKV